MSFLLGVYMLIVIEGPDGAGKTTLIEALRKNAERYFLIARSSGYPKDDETAHRYVKAMGRLSSLMHPTHIVCDRYIPISELIYRPICRGAFYPFHPDQLRWVDRIIYCRPPIEFILKNLTVNEQMKGVSERIEMIVAAYDDFMERECPYATRYDYTRSSPDYVARMIGL